MSRIVKEVTVGDGSRRFIIMGFNYERGLGEMLESYGHRAESIMDRVFRDKALSF